MDLKDRVETLIKTKASSLHKRINGNDTPAGAGYQVDQAEVEAILTDWPAAPKKVAQGLLDRYGSPNEATPSQLIWHGYDFGGAFGDPDTFLATAQALENTGVAAYIGAAQYLIGSPELLTAALTIHGVEARHASYLNRLNGVSPFPDAVDAPLTPDEVLTIATPFIAATPAAQAGSSQAPGEVATVEEEEVARGGGRRNRVNEMPSVGVGTGLRPAAHADVQKIGLAGMAGVAAATSVVLAYRGRASEAMPAGGGSDR